jgi:hypothetical protein
MPRGRRGSPRSWRSSASGCSRGPPTNQRTGLADRLATLDENLAKLEQDSLGDPEELRRLRGRDRQIAEARRLAKFEVERARLEDERRALLKQMQREAEADVVTVEFNAWRFENAEQIWAGLAREITKRFETALPRHSRILSRFAYAIAKRPAEFWSGW